MTETHDENWVEWPTLVLMLACYVTWGLALFWVSALWLPLGMLLATLCVALHSSLTHELIHGHPFRSAWANEVLGFFCLGLFVPYRRFQDLHLAHHQDGNLTDPYDDPESNYLDPGVWSRLPLAMRWLLRVNNTLLGRMIVGPAVGQLAFLREDLAAIKAGNTAVRMAWVLQIPSVALVLVMVIASPMPLWAYLICAYAGYGIIKIRTFLEHRAHDRASGRTVVVEGGGLLSFLFLNNNLHVVHHMHPGVAWYKLPALWRAKRDHYLRRNEGYYYQSYAEIFRAHLLRAKDPVPHPLRTQSDWPAE
ncbi:fatty acid desaturase [Roseovarius phycicola]|uniref:Fatty acid desaturase n=1 Tax=Roseovarius phycicola TaxID=3080976 RepID=A0ABZ2HI75_9RHOB